jgi:hypothetical protein
MILPPERCLHTTRRPANVCGCAGFFGRWIHCQCPGPVADGELIRSANMNTLARLFLTAAVGACMATAQAQNPKTPLREVEERIGSVLAGLNPPPTVEYPEQTQSLVFRYRPQKFLVHGRSKAGGCSTNVFEEIGPSVTGFVLRVNLQRLGEVNQAVTPQTIQEPYWRTFLDVTRIAGTTNQIYWALSSGGRTDEKLLASVRQALDSVARKTAKPGAEPDGQATRGLPVAH